MSRAFDEVLQYANEDVISTRKHWIIFVHMARRIILFAIAAGFLYYRAHEFLGSIGDFINSLISALPFSIRDNLLAITIEIVFVYALIDFIKTYIIYKTVGLKANNIQIIGKSGLADIGQISASIDQLGCVKTHIPLLGRICHYGSIEINLPNNSFTMPYMTNVESFQESVTILQTAAKEKLNMQNAKYNAEHNFYIMEEQTIRDDASRRNAALLQGQAIAAAITQSQQPVLETAEPAYIEAN